MSVRRLSFLQSNDSTGPPPFSRGLGDVNVLFQEFFNFLSLKVKASKNKSRLWTCFDLSWIDRFLLNYQLVGKEIGMLSLTFILLLVTVACSIS
mgnify:FL=1